MEDTDTDTDTDTIRLLVGGRDFVVPVETLRAHPDSLLAKCCVDVDVDVDAAAASPFRPHRRDGRGAFVFARDAHLFERVVLPVLRTGYFDDAGVDPFAALQELHYFCLVPTATPRTAAPCARALSAAEAAVLCRVMLARLVQTLPAGQMGMQLLLLAEELKFDPLHPALDVGLFVTALGAMFRSLALMEHQVVLQWSCFDAEVSYCNRLKSYRTATAQEPVYAFSWYDCEAGGPAAAVWEVAACARLEDAGLDRVTNWMFLTPNRYLYDCREADVRVAAAAEGPCPVRVQLRMCYDLVQKCTLVDCTAAPAGPWTGSYQSYLWMVVAGRRGEADDGGGVGAPAPPADLATLDDVYAWLKRDARWVAVTAPAASRVFDGASACSLKNQRFMADEYVAYALVCRHPACTERVAHEDPAAERKRLVGNLAPLGPGTTAPAHASDMRVVNPTRVRRLCRLQLLAVQV